MEGFFALVGLVLLGVAVSIPIMLITILSRQSELSDAIKRLGERLDRLSLGGDAHEESVEKPRPPLYRGVSAPSPAEPKPVMVKREEAEKPDVPISPPPPRPVPIPIPPPLVEARTSEAPSPSLATPLASSQEKSTPAEKQPVMEDHEERQPGAIEVATMNVLRRIWSWIIVGEEHRDASKTIEFSVGTTWSIRLAIILFVVGAGYGYRLSVAYGVLSSHARVGLGLASGLGMVAAGVFLLRGKRYRVVGQGVLGGGLAILYTCLFAAHHVYQIVTSWQAFTAMGVVTLLAGVLAVCLSSQLVAILGIVGGYVAPFILSGSGYAGFGDFFGYLLALGIGILIVTRFRDWELLNYLGLFCAYLHVLLVVCGNWKSAQTEWKVVLTMLSLLFVLHSLVAMIHNILERRRSTLIPLFGLLTNVTVYYLLSRHLIVSVGSRSHAAILSAGLTLFYMSFTALFFRREVRDRALLLFLLALSSLFAAITIPELLSGASLTVGWALLALMMLWLAKRLGSQFLCHFSLALYLLVFLRLAILQLPAMLDIRAVSGWAAYWPMLLERLLDIGIPIVSFFVASRILNSPKGEESKPVDAELDISFQVPENTLVRIFVALTLCFAFGYTYTEVARFFATVHAPLEAPMLSALAIGFAIWLLTRHWLCRESKDFVTVLIWAGILVCAKFVIFDLAAWGFSPSLLRYDPSSCHWYTTLVRTLDWALIIAFLAWAGTFCRSHDQDVGAFFGGGSLAVLFVFLSLESNTFLASFIPDLRAGGISILWSLFALALLIRGIYRNRRNLRFCSLGLFAIVAVKVFFFDLANLGAVYRMVALLVMGPIFLVGSLAYLRNAERFQCDTEEENEEQETTDEASGDL